MIKLHLSTLTAALNDFLPAKDFEVKSISAAWNKIREIRDLDVSTALLDGLLITVNMGEEPASSRLPLEILFQINTKGKIEFKDMQKIREKAAKRMAEAETEKEVKAEKTAASRAGKKKFETKAGKIEIGKIFNPTY